MLRPGTQDTYISRRVNLPTAKSHAELVSDVEPKIKAQAFFSARVAEAHILDRLRRISDGYSRGEFGLGEARNRLKDFLRAEGYDPHQGGMRNLASTGRLNLILKQNAAMAKAAGEWKRMHDPDAMKVFPYVRYHARSDSRTRSDHAHLDGRIFRKDDPFLSTHTPPWEFNCRCWLEEISEKEAGKTPDLIQPPTPPDKVTVDSKSGFSFDPAHAFEKFDYDAIKDPDLREKAKSGVEKILAGESPAQAPAVPAPSDPSDQSDPSDNSRKPEPVREPEVKTPIQEPEPAEKPAPVKEPEPVNALIREPEPNKPEPVREPEVKQPVKVSSPGNDQEPPPDTLHYLGNRDKFMEETAAELKRRVAAESSRKIFPKEPKEFLKGEALKKAEEEARKAVPGKVMDAVDQKIREIGEDAVEPFLHYSSRPGDSENVSVRQAAFKDGKLDWTGVKVSEERKQAVADLQNLLEIMPKFHGTLYRGCSFDNVEDAETYLRKIFERPETLRGFISTSPDPVVAAHYAGSGKYKVVVVIPNSRNSVYFGPHSKHPEDEEALISYKFYLKGLKRYEKDGILYVLAEEVPR